MKTAVSMLWKPVQCGPCKTDPGKVDDDLKCDICNDTDNIQEYFLKHGISYQEQYAGGEILEILHLLCQFKPCC